MTYCYDKDLKISLKFASVARVPYWNTHVLNSLLNITFIDPFSYNYNFATFYSVYIGTRLFRSCTLSVSVCCGDYGEREFICQVVVVVVVNDETDADTTCLFVRVSNLLSNVTLYSFIVTSQ